MARRLVLPNDLNEISRALLVRSLTVREKIREAQRSAAQGDFTWAIAHLRFAFDEARREFRKTQPHPWRIWHMEVSRAVQDATGTRHGAGRVSALQPGSLIRLLERIVERIETVEDRMEALSLGAHAGDYVWFARVAPEPYRQVNERGEETWVLGNERPRTRAEYVRGPNFTIAAVLYWEALQSPAAEAD